MRLLLLVIFTVHSTAYCNCQIIKLFCFEQPVNGGIIKKDDNVPRGDAIDITQTSNSRFFLFAEVKKNSKMIFSQVWIKGKKYNFTVQPLEKLPFILTTNNGGGITVNDTLIKKSGFNLFYLKNLAEDEKTLKSNVSATENNVVVYYKFKNTTMKSRLKYIKTIRPLFTQ